MRDRFCQGLRNSARGKNAARRHTRPECAPLRYICLQVHGTIRSRLKLSAIHLEDKIQCSRRAMMPSSQPSWHGTETSYAVSICVLDSKIPVLDSAALTNTTRLSRGLLLLQSTWKTCCCRECHGLAPWSVTLLSASGQRETPRDKPVASRQANTLLGRFDRGAPRDKPVASAAAESSTGIGETDAARTLSKSLSHGSGDHVTFCGAQTFVWPALLERSNLIRGDHVTSDLIALLGRK